MKTCAACLEELPRDRFSKRQWQLKHHRRCKGCIDTNRNVLSDIEATKKSEVQSAATPQCFICLKVTDELGHQTRRDCSCRGDAGFAHLNCIVECAKSKSRSSTHNPDVFADPWLLCHYCRQRYQNELGLDLIGEFVAFAEREYADNQVLLLKSLDRKATVLIENCSSSSQREEVKQTALQILSLLGQIEKPDDDPQLSLFLMIVEGGTYARLGQLALNEGSKDSAVVAIKWFEKSRDIGKAMGHDAGVTAMDFAIATAEAILEGREMVYDEDELKRSKAMYEHSLKQFSQGNYAAIDAGNKYASELYSGGHVLGAERLLTELAATSRRFHGPEHRLTKKVTSHLSGVKVRLVWVNVILESENMDMESENMESEKSCVLFSALRYEAGSGGKKLVVKGPIRKPRNIEQEKTYTVASETVLPVPNRTPVMIRHGLESTASPSADFEGKLGLVQRWNREAWCFEVRFEDREIEPCLVKQENVRIAFELP